MKKSVLREYAKLLVRTGVNIQKGQDLLIYADDFMKKRELSCGG